MRPRSRSTPRPRRSIQAPRRLHRHQQRDGHRSREPDDPGTSGETTSTVVSTGTKGPSTTTEGPGTNTGVTSQITTGPAGVCGDGNVDAGEECDDGNNDDNDACTHLQVRPPVCGDGILGPARRATTATPTTTTTAPPRCKPAACGDGISSRRRGLRRRQPDRHRRLPRRLQAAPAAATASPGRRETCDDGFDDNDYGGCAVDCKSKASEYCGDGKTQKLWEHSDGATGIAGLTAPRAAATTSRPSRRCPAT